MKNKLVPFLVIAGFIFTSLKVSRDGNSAIGVSNGIAYFEREVINFALANERLQNAVQAISKDSSTIFNARAELRNCRLIYKKIEFFTQYFFPSETRFYNAAAKFEVEEPTLELVEPMGLQQMEALLFDEDVIANKSTLLANAQVLVTSSKDLKNLLYSFTATDAQVLESLRIELIRMSVLAISGYDAPVLKTGIEETAAATESFIEILKPYVKANNVRGSKIMSLLQSSLNYLKANTGFDSFNRMEYLLRFALPLQKELAVFIREQGLEIRTSKYLNYNAENIYSKDALSSWADTNARHESALINLGKQLFYDKSLSGNLTVSCASCHQPNNFFSDPLPLSLSINPDSTLKRNTPSLFYASMQHSQFWDGRAGGLPAQIHSVFFSPAEMNGSLTSLEKNVIRTGKYKDLLKACFPARATDSIGLDEITAALSAFIQQLNPMSSAFDRYLKGENTAMTEDQIKGFNLFMGKAQCGTCHFPPYFNSLLPPLYELSEVEVLGTPITDNFKNPVIDNDPGRSALYNISYYKRAFKTPTVRNTAKTAPYMHNGGFRSLESVVQFYNLGGGKGIGLEVPGQTLSSKPLHLTDRETRHLIAFLESLTDSITSIPAY